MPKRSLLGRGKGDGKARSGFLDVLRSSEHLRRLMSLGIVGEEGRVLVLVENSQAILKARGVLTAEVPWTFCRY